MTGSIPGSVIGPTYCMIIESRSSEVCSSGSCSPIQDSDGNNKCPGNRAVRG